MSSTRDSSEDAESSSAPRRINLHIPSSLIILPTSAALVGLAIGMSRGGSRARLRFLAENAHRQPRTVQGWGKSWVDPKYFYTKTRNYRVFFAAAKTGAKYAAGLGGATAGFVLLKEGFGWTREQVMGTSQPAPLSSIKGRRAVDENGMEGWLVDEAHWMDGTLAGGTMGSIVGAVYRLPRPLFIRSLLLGAIMGGSTSALEMAQAQIGRLREAERTSTPSSSSRPTTGPEAGGPMGSHLAPELGMIGDDRALHPIVDRPLFPSPPGIVDPAAEGFSTMGPQRGWYDPRRWVGW